MRSLVAFFVVCLAALIVGIQLIDGGTITPHPLVEQFGVVLFLATFLSGVIVCILLLVTWQHRITTRTRQEIAQLSESERVSRSKRYSWVLPAFVLFTIFAIPLYAVGIILEVSWVEALSPVIFIYYFFFVPTIIYLSIYQQVAKHLNRWTKNVPKD